ncbi:type II secretion system protein, partial [Streptococcus sanguinis]
FLQKRRGVTLVEVLISLIILSVVTVSLLAFFSTGYQSIMRQRGQNIENFDAQESFEKRLSQIKREGGHGTETENFVYRKGNEASRSIPVKGQTLSYDDKKKVLRLFVANAKESVLDIPTDLSVRLKDSKGFYYVGEDAPEGEASLNQGQQNNKSKIHLESGWFEGDRNIEKDGERLVPIGTPGNRIASNNSRIVFPSMPGDFTLKPNLSNRKFTITDSMRGKYLTYAARAINSFGRVGEYQEAEKRIWVMGLPVTNNLEVHTDADLILQKNGDGSKSLL